MTAATRACPCGFVSAPQRSVHHGRSSHYPLRCRSCGLSGAPSSSADERIASWNEAVGERLGEPRAKPADWVDLPVTFISETGLHWKVGKDDIGPLWISKYEAQLERGVPGAVVTLSIPVGYAQRMGLIAC